MCIYVYIYIHIMYLDDICIVWMLCSSLLIYVGMCLEFFGMWREVLLWPADHSSARTTRRLCHPHPSRAGLLLRRNVWSASNCQAVGQLILQDISGLSSDWSMFISLFNVHSFSLTSSHLWVFNWPWGTGSCPGWLRRHCIRMMRYPISWATFVVFHGHFCHGHIRVTFVSHSKLS